MILGKIIGAIIAFGTKAFLLAVLLVIIAAAIIFGPVVALALLVAFLVWLLGS